LEAGEKGPTARLHGGAADRARTLYFVAAAVLAALVPLILFAGLWVRSELRNDERDLQTYLTERATALSARLDTQVQQQLSVLQAISGLPSLDRPDLVTFHLAASRMAEAIPELAVLNLSDPSTGRQLLNTARPLGTDLPATIPEDVLRRLSETRQPVVHTRYAGQGGIYDQHAVLLYVPVVREHELRYVLGAAMRAEVVQDVLTAFQGQGLLTVVVDEREHILARSRLVDRFIGRQANEQLRNSTKDRQAGLFTAATLDGQEVFTAFQRSALTGWIAVVATDREQIDLITQRSTWTLVGSGALALVLAAILGVFLFYNVVDRRVSAERFAASQALGELDARLLHTTQEALAEQRKAASEREVLLREIYHRVKNNLQIIQSLLRLGSRHLSHEQREPFESAIQRIGAMARVHTLLYRSADLASIDLKDYLDEVVKETADGFGAEVRGIRTDLDAASMRIPLDTAVPLAFIAVEILTNAFKHAFPEGGPGVVTVKAWQEGEHGWLTISDNGVGVPDRKGVARRSLGLTLVTKLVDQIGGTLEAPAPGQSTYTVGFPLTPPPQPSLPEAATA
jgi:two-component sensor histidine kinase